MSDTRSAATIASLALTVAAIAAAQPEQTAGEATLLALQTQVNATLAIAIAEQTLLAGSSLAVDVASYLWVTNVIYSLQSYLATLGAYTGATSAVTYNPNGGDCFSLAALFYGDWTQYTTILLANSAALGSDPFIVGSPTLTIPQT